MSPAESPQSEWARIEALFEQAVAADAEARRGLLEKLRAEEPALCARVERLLEADAAAGVLDMPLGDAIGGMLETGAFAPGARVGNYRVVREVGRGGMGAVYLAERADGAFEQQVALKVVRAGALAGLLERRFLRERQILARLAHPNIARLLDAGVTEAGVPWLAMEYVRGEPITNWAAGHALSIAERVRLFLEVCAAVQFAHRNLVIHRDLKPGNIFVDGEGHARLLDFGIARLLDDAAAEGATRTEHLLLTPEYAAPEQIRGEAASTATDVFALGAVLYELLTERKAVKLASNDIAEILRVSALDAMAPSRVPDLPAGVGAQLRGDLDAIILKALARDAERRYGSVESLAADLRRHLAHQPIEAQPDSWWYSAGKFVRRYRTGVAATTAVALAVAAGLVGTAWQSHRRGLEARKAEEVKAFALSLFSGADPARARGEELTAKELVAEGATRIEREFANEPAVKAEVLTFLADIHEKLGEADKALPMTGEALTLLNVAGNPDKVLEGNALQVQGRALLAGGKAEDAKSRLEDALKLHRATGAELEASEDLDYLAIHARQGGKVEDSLAFTQEALAIRQRLLGKDHPRVAESLMNLGVLSREAGKYDDALAYYQSALAIREKVLPPDHPDMVITNNNLGALLLAQGRYADSEQSFRRVLELDRRIYGESHQITIGAMNNLGSALLLQAKYAEAEPILQDVLTYWRKNAGPEHPNALTTLNNLASTYRGAGQFDKARPLYEQLIVAWAKVGGPQHPNLAVAHHHLGTISLELGDTKGADEHLHAALDIRRAARGEKHPEFADSLRELGALALYRGEVAEADRLSARAIEIQKAGLDATHPLYAATLIVRGRVLRAQQNYTAAREVDNQALSILRGRFGDDHPDVARAALELGRADCLAARWDDAVREITEARRVLALRYGESSWRVADADSWLAAAMNALEQPGARERATAAAVALARDLPASHPARVDNARLVAGIGG
jgi:tetratricopeptide (TPR) repeat protein/predicted Ser/Thr protein kinase